MQFIKRLLLATWAGIMVFWHALLNREEKSEEMYMGFGSQAEWERFNRTFPRFVKRYEALEATRDKIFVRRGEPGSRVDRVIFGLGRICMEDFQQALILCGNGFGIGALQMVRGMYEREVTAAYLSEHPGEVDNFLDYHFVHVRKAMNHVRNIYNGEELDRLIPRARQEEIEQQYLAVRDRYIEPLCNTCGTTRPQISWTRLATDALARRGGQGLEQMYYHQYFRPTLYSHSTVSSLVARMVENDAGEVSFESDGQRKHIREALVAAHNLLLHVFYTHNKHFRLGLDDEIEQRFQDFKECWVEQEAS